MFTVLGAYLDQLTTNTIKSLLEKTGLATDFISICSETEGKHLINHRNIHLCLVSMDSHPEEAFSLLNDIHDSQRNRLSPVILFSNDKAQLTKGFFCVGCCRYFFLPLTKKDHHILTELFHFTYKQFEALFHIQSKQERHLYLGSGSLTYNIPFRKILFIESVQHKCLVHTMEEVISVTDPLYKIKEKCPINVLVQCHRSFLINPNHVHYIDKSLEPWIVYFKGYSQRACISRGYRKDFVNTYLKKDPT